MVRASDMDFEDLRVGDIFFFQSSWSTPILILVTFVDKYRSTPYMCSYAIKAGWSSISSYPESGWQSHNMILIGNCEPTVGEMAWFVEERRKEDVNKWRVM